MVKEKAKDSDSPTKNWKATMQRNCGRVNVMCFRKRSPATIEVEGTDSVGKKRSASKSNASGLALHVNVIGDEISQDAEAEAVPLKMYEDYPPKIKFSAEEEEKCFQLRRSPRNTTNKYTSAESSNVKSLPLPLPALSQSEEEITLTGGGGALQLRLRRSPRLSSGLVSQSHSAADADADADAAAALESNLLKIKWQDSSSLSLEKRRRSNGNSDARVVGSNNNNNYKWLNLRLGSMRVDDGSGSGSGSAIVLFDSSTTNEEQPCKKVKKKKKKIWWSSDSDSDSEMMLTMSPPTTAPSPSLLSSNSSVGLGLGTENNFKKIQIQIQNQKTTCDSNVLGEKCLRSTTTTTTTTATVPFPLLLVGSGSDDNHVGDSNKPKSSLIEFPDISEQQQQPAEEEIKKTISGSGSDDNHVDDSNKPKSALIEFPDISEQQQQPAEEEIKKTISGSGSGSCEDSHVLDLVVVDKCLRSRKIPFRVVGTENDQLPPHVSADQNQSQNIRKTRVSSSSSEDKQKQKQNNESKPQKTTSFFIGAPVPDQEARERWGWRYELKSQRYKCQSWKLNAGEEDEIILNVEWHYTQAKVGSCIFNLGDCAYIKGDGRQKYVGRIVELFKTMEGENYFRVQWFFRAEDTVMKKEAAFHDKRRLFYSTLMNDNLLDCIVSKVSVIQIAPTLGMQLNSIPPYDFYYDMEYCVEYSTFRSLLTDDSVKSNDLSTPDDIEAFCAMITATPLEDMPSCETYKAELALLDLYSGCGGMSTGLCLGAKLSSVSLVTRWAVDADRSACDSLRLNHPETQVRNETAEDFLELLKGWEKLCQWYVFNNLHRTLKSRAEETREVKSDVNSPSGVKIPSGEYEVLTLVDICYGDPCKTGKRGLKFKVRWKGYSSGEDTWEPIEGLSNCQERIQDFVRSGFKCKILPLPGDVDVLCGGPPCQGISGYNRFRNIDAPLDDERNRQIVVFMDIVKFLRPKYVLMENVVDILRFDKASLARYALSRMVHMKYQARLGTIAAGCYGLPQFRLRVFLWGALPSEKLPQFPLPTHDVVVRYWPPPEFERNTVAYDEGKHRELEEAVILRDAISDLPAVTNHEFREQMTYEMPPETAFQKNIRLTKDEMMRFAEKGVTEVKNPILYDHRPYQLFEDDYLRVCQIPHKKGANFRDLPGVVVGPDNVAHRDLTKEQMMLPSGKPMVPDYALTFEQGKSKRPFARLWWDETVATVVTFPNLHSQAALHPEQDRVLTIREYARLQGFPDFYRFCGTVKERYCQVGNAVAVPVARALGYALGMAFQKLGGNEPLMTLPPKFAFQRFPTDK